MSVWSSWISNQYVLYVTSAYAMVVITMVIHVARWLRQKKRIAKKLNIWFLDKK